MGFQILPNNLGQGSVFNQISGPLSSLYNPSTPANLVYPSDLASNPAMCHAIQFSIYDYTTGFSEAINKGIDAVGGTSLRKVGNALNEFALNGTEAINKGIQKTTSAMALSEKNDGVTNAQKAQLFSEIAQDQGVEVLSGISNISAAGAAVFQAPFYRPKQKGSDLARISLYMPDNLSISHNANYSDVSMTDTLGYLGLAASAYADLKGKSASEIANFLPRSALGKDIASRVLGGIANKIPGASGGGAEDVIKNALGIYVNPQIQLIYKGINLRDFSLNFTFTPKSAQEAQTTKNIIDTFTYYSVPGIGSAMLGSQPGQYLTPPQLFKIKFIFLGQNGVAGSISNVFSSALSNLGLNSLITSNTTDIIKNGQQAKVMTVSECVLTSVAVDYAPNGWAAFNDGHPVQTTMTLHFQETEIMTKDRVGNSAVAGNFEKRQLGNSVAATLGLTGIDDPNIGV